MLMVGTFFMNLNRFVGRMRKWVYPVFCMGMGGLILIALLSGHVHNWVLLILAIPVGLTIGLTSGLLIFPGAGRE